MHPVLGQVTRALVVALARDIAVRFQHVKAHAGHPWNELADAVAAAAKRGGGAEPLLLVTGHSMGAALATIAALDIAANFPMMAHRIQLINFGSPPVGNAAGGDASTCGPLLPRPCRLRLTPVESVSRSPAAAAAHPASEPRDRGSCVHQPPC